MSVLIRAVRFGDVTELTKALPSVRGVDGHGQHVYGASSPDRVSSLGGSSSKGRFEERQAEAGVVAVSSAGAQESSRLPAWRPVSLAETDASGQTALHLAAQIGNVGVVSLLLERGAELNARDVRGCTPFVLAARHGKATIAAALVSAALRTEHATRGKSEDLECMLDREARDALLAMVHNAADAGDVVGVRYGLEAVANLVAKAIRIGDTLYIEKILGAGLEIETSAAAVLARRHSQTAMAKFLGDLSAARAPQQLSMGSSVEDEAGNEKDDAAGESDEEDDGAGQAAHENRVVSVAERLVQGEVRLLAQALAETDLVKIDRILATHRESFRSLPIAGSQMLGAAASGRVAVREAWHCLKRRRRELQKEQRENRNFSAAETNKRDEMTRQLLGRQQPTQQLCGICQEMLRPPACQCVKGHIFCSTCLKDSLERIPECPIW
eukprot:COSAG02_NODE_608_length_19607_cov_201.543059_5_plen_441_part_00